ACVLFPANMGKGLEFAENLRIDRGEFEQDLMAGMPASMLAEQYTALLNPSWTGDVHDIERDAVRDGLHVLHRRQVGMFKHLGKEVAFREVPVPLKPAATEGMTWDGEEAKARAYTTEPTLTFQLDRPQKVYAVRLVCKLTYPDKKVTPAN